MEPASPFFVTNEKLSFLCNLFLALGIASLFLQEVSLLSLWCALLLSKFPPYFPAGYEPLFCGFSGNLANHISSYPYPTARFRNRYFFLYTQNAPRYFDSSSLSPVSFLQDPGVVTQLYDVPSSNER